MKTSGFHKEREWELIGEKLVINDKNHFNKYI